MSDATGPSPKLARRLLVAVVALAGIEWVASAIAYRSAIDDEDWDEAAAALEPALPVYVATAWLDPLARMELEPVARLENVARPDLRGQPRFHVIGRGDDWSAELEADLEDLPRPVLESSVDAGALTISTYALETTPAVDAVLGHAGLEVEADGQRCKQKGRTPHFDCGDRGSGKQPVEADTIEVDYRPRRCIAIDVADGRAVTLRVNEFAFGDVLRGHVGVDDFNARLRSDASLALEARVDGEVVARWTFGDSGWTPFAVATPAPLSPGAATLELVAVPSVRGTWGWGGEGYGQRLNHRFCIEARSFTEGGA